MATFYSTWKLLEMQKVKHVHIPTLLGGKIALNFPSKNFCKVKFVWSTLLNRVEN